MSITSLGKRGSAASAECLGRPRLGYPFPLILKTHLNSFEGVIAMGGSGDDPDLVVQNVYREDRELRFGLEPVEDPPSWVCRIALSPVA